MLAGGGPVGLAVGLDSSKDTLAAVLRGAEELLALVGHEEATVHVQTVVLGAVDHAVEEEDHVEDLGVDVHVPRHEAGAERLLCLVLGVDAGLRLAQELLVLGQGVQVEDRLAGLVDVARAEVGDGEAREHTVVHEARVGVGDGRDAVGRADRREDLRGLLALVVQGHVVHDAQRGVKLGLDARGVLLDVLVELEHRRPQVRRDDVDGAVLLDELDVVLLLAVVHELEKREGHGDDVLGVLGPTAGLVEPAGVLQKLQQGGLDLEPVQVRVGVHLRGAHAVEVLLEHARRERGHRRRHDEGVVDLAAGLPLRKLRGGELNGLLAVRRHDRDELRQVLGGHGPLVRGEGARLAGAVEVGRGQEAGHEGLHARELGCPVKHLCELCNVDAAVGALLAVLVADVGQLLLDELLGDDLALTEHGGALERHAVLVLILLVAFVVHALDLHLVLLAGVHHLAVDVRQVLALLTGGGLAEVGDGVAVEEVLRVGQRRDKGVGELHAVGEEVLEVVLDALPLLECVAPFLGAARLDKGSGGVVNVFHAALVLGLDLAVLAVVVTVVVARGRDLFQEGVLLLGCGGLRGDLLHGLEALVVAVGSGAGLRRGVAPSSKVGHDLESFKKNVMCVCVLLSDDQKKRSACFVLLFFYVYSVSLFPAKRSVNKVQKL
eukprot:PhM_4_TR14199/c1_g1_i1/m.27961